MRNNGGATICYTTSVCQFRNSLNLTMPFFLQPAAFQLNVENIPPCPANTLPPQKDPVLQAGSSPMKSGLRPSTAFAPPPDDISNSADMDLD